MNGKAVRRELLGIDRQRGVSHLKIDIVKARHFLAVSLFLFLTATVYPQSQGPTDISKHSQQQQSKTSSNQQHTGDRNDIPNQVARTDSNITPIKTDQNPTNDKEKTNEDTPADRAIMWATIIIAGSAIAQVIAMIRQYRAMRKQVKYLRRTVQAAREAAEDTRKVIAQAERSATAMESIATSTTENVTRLKEVFARQERFGKMQLRAYLSTDLRAEIPQQRNIGWRETVQMNITNLGNTPARETKSHMRAAIMDYPLPDDFDLSLSPPVEEGSDINPRQVRFIGAALDDFITDERMRQIKQDISPKLYVWGTVWYKDVFGESHETRFCHFCRWDVKDVMTIYNAPRHNNET